ncbi:MAG: TolC family protein, partial [Silvibacterium sp.]|nr:TolC family protein [Silvibacterium sp.]
MRRRHSKALIPALCLAIAGCTVGPNYQRPSVPPAPAAYKELPPPNPPNGTWKTAQPSDALLKGKWWEIYNDPQLNDLEEKLTVSNQNLKAATEQYFQAREQVRVARSTYYPTVSAGPAISRQQTSANQVGAVRGTTYNTFALTGQVSWEPDLWGQIRRTVEQTRANAQASAADLANIELSLRSELAVDYFEMRGLDTQKQLLDNTVASDADYLQLTERRFKGGVA